MKSYATGLWTVLLTVLIGNAWANANLCCLCNGCSAPINGRGTMAVDANRYTCNALALDMANPNNHIRVGTAICNQLKSTHFRRCCDSTFNPPIIQQANVRANANTNPGARYPSGPHGLCNLCSNGQMPSKPATAVAVLHHSLVTNCIGAYYAGRQGYFEARYCRPMQNAFQSACGCNVAPANTSNGGTSPFVSFPSVARFESFARDYC